MTQDEIKEQGKFITNKTDPEYSELRLEIYLPFFEEKVNILAVELSSLEAEEELAYITKVVNELLAFDLQNKVWLKREVWEHYQAIIANSSYGMVSMEGYNNEKEANAAYFKIYTDEDAYDSVKLTKIWFDVMYREDIYFNLIYSCPWEDEHGIKIGVKNGELDSIE